MECKGIFLGQAPPSPLTPQNFVGCLPGTGESPGANVADPRFLYDPGRNSWGKIMVGGSQEHLTDTHLGFPRAWHSGSQLTD